VLSASALLLASPPPAHAADAGRNTSVSGTIGDALPLPGIAHGPVQASIGEKAYSVGGALHLFGPASYFASNSNGTVELQVGELANDSMSTTSGSIRLRMIVTTAPIVNGQPFNYWIIGEDPFSPLPPQTAYFNIDDTVTLQSAPDGVYYVYFGAFEFEGSCGSADGYCLDWFLGPFPNLVQFSGGVISQYTAPTVTAVEYFYAAWGYYFVTAFATEIAALDAGAFGGVWQRTGNDFLVWPQPTGTASATCRFFSVAFAPRSSHFYTPFAAECAAVKINSAWQYEGIAFYIQQADVNGLCPVGTVTLYRVYNNGMGGSPNHRYTTSIVIFNQMLAAGWIFEGNGITKAFACVPG
jgi:hypothetical protein